MDTTSPSSPAVPIVPKELSAPGKILNDAFLFYREHLSLFLTIAVLTFAANLSALVAADKVRADAPKIVLLLFSVAVGVIAQLAFLHIVLKGVMSAGGALRAGMKLFFSGLAIVALMGLAVFGGLLLFIVPGLMIAFLLVFSSYTLVMTDRRGLKALAYSWSLVRSSPGAIVWRFLFMGIVVAGATFLSEIVLLPLKGMFVHDVLAQALSAFLLTPLAVIFCSLLFMEVRSRVPELASEEELRIIHRLKIFSALGVVAIGIVILLATLFVGFMAGQFFHVLKGAEASGAMIVGAPFLNL